MKLEDITVSLELAQELKEQGFNQEGLFYHYVHPESDSEFVESINYQGDELTHGVHVAPTTDELLYQLPKSLLYENYWAFLNIRFQHQGIFPIDKWGIFYESSKRWFMEEDKKFPDALAKMWLHLKKNNLLGGK